MRRSPPTTPSCSRSSSCRFEPPLTERREMRERPLPSPL
uniref:Uncharacterized protein n=1 Tax=Arundo donax TaxID=35708 RepID=A0A0A9GW69_ARUDO